jgi:hypothetical protein
MRNHQHSRPPRQGLCADLVLPAIVAFLAIGAPDAEADGPGPARVPAPPDASAFFEKRVRPVLAQNCQKCHGAAKQASGLRLDSRDAVLRGGATGPAVVPGDPEDSPLIRAVRHEGDVRMPPKGRLPESAVRALTDWVRMGAPWPDEARPTAGPAGDRAEAARRHWAFRRVQGVTPPPVSDATWAASPVDSFILAGLEARGLRPSGPADKRTLIRRATFDLIGLPPTEQEIAGFEADASPDAFARVVDRLLASPHYGERWGRHWLDVARYADTKGYVFVDERRYPFAYTYRDWVIRAFNEDLPYDQFLVRQIAADRLPTDADDNRDLAALGFLTVGRRFLNDQNDIIDDRIDVVTRGLMGLTVACARCHDHKYDPIPTADYYSLYGVFASSLEPAELPEIRPSGPRPGFEDYLAQGRRRKAEVDAYLEKKRAEIQGQIREKLVAAFVAAYDLGFQPGHPRLDDSARQLGMGAERFRWLVGRLERSLARTKDAHDPLFGPWHALAALPADRFADEAGAALARLVPGTAEGRPADPLVVRTLAEPPPGSMREVARRFGELFRRAATEAGPEWAALRAELDSAEGAFTLPIDEVAQALHQGEQGELAKLSKKLGELEISHPGAPPRAMVLEDAPEPAEPRVFLRGNPGRPGPQVPRRSPAILAGADRRPFREGSGRLELARAIVSPENPLTARVMVNRVWMHHFGQGLVRTPGDFGLRSEPPSHSELLDFLARRFVEGGWSVKALHRLILLSRTYQQASDDRDECRDADPTNALLWRQNRRRLDFEAMRDGLLAVAGRLDRTVGGRPVSITEPPFSTRRTVYALVDRQNLDGLFRTFDFASPDATSPRRHATIVPQQALFLMNSPFVAEQARHLAASLEATGPAAPGERVRQLYRRVLGRDPEARELERASRFLAAPLDAGDSPPATPLEVLAQVLMLTNEFFYID